MRSPSYQHNGFVATHALGHTMDGYTFLVPINQRVLNKLSKEQSCKAIMVITGRAHCFHDNIHIMLILLL